MSQVDYAEHKFSEVFDDTYEQIKRLKKADPTFGIPDLEGMLESQYAFEGTDWIDHSPLGHIVSEATIAAFQQILLEWRRERNALSTN